MITKEQALNVRGEIHFGECRRNVGPRGGVTIEQVRVRPSGRCQTWKTRPEEFRLPVKHGMWESSEITHRNADEFHLASECPLEKEESK